MVRRMYWMPILGIMQTTRSHRHTEVVALSGINPFEMVRTASFEVSCVRDGKGTDIYNESTDAYAPGKYVPGTLYDPIKRNTELEANKYCRDLDMPRIL